jgi:hypothetical protein
LKINLFTPCRVLGSKLILTSSSSSPDFLAIVGSSRPIRPGKTKNRSEAELGEAKINGLLGVIPDTHFIKLE